MEELPYFDDKFSSEEMPQNPFTVASVSRRSDYKATGNICTPD